MMLSSRHPDSRVYCICILAIILVCLAICCCRRVLDARDGRGARVESDDMLPLEEHVGLDSESSLKDPSGPPFGIVVNGHSLVRQ